MNRLLGGILAFVFASSLLAIGTPAEAAKFRIGAHRSLWGAWEVVAHKKGYFKEAGLDYTFTYFKQGKLMRNAILQDNLDVGTTGFSPFVTAIGKGAKVEAIGVTANICSLTYVMVPKNSKAKSIADLKGTTFATKKGTSVDFAFRSYMLPRYNLTDKDLNWLSINTTDRIAALEAGSAQGAIVNDPMAEIAVQKGYVRKLEDFCAYDKTRMMHVGNPQTLKKHPGLYVKYFKGWLRAHKLLKDNPEEFARVYTASLVEVGQKAEYKVILPVVKRFRSEPFITKEVRTYLNDMGDKQEKLGWIRHHPDFVKSKWLNDSLLRKAASEISFPIN